MYIFFMEKRKISKLKEGYNPILHSGQDRIGYLLESDLIKWPGFRKAVIAEIYAIMNVRSPLASSSENLALSIEKHYIQESFKHPKTASLEDSIIEKRNQLLTIYANVLAGNFDANLISEVTIKAIKHPNLLKLMMENKENERVELLKGTCEILIRIYPNLEKKKNIILEQLKENLELSSRLNEIETKYQVSKIENLESFKNKCLNFITSFDIIVESIQKLLPEELGLIKDRGGLFKVLNKKVKNPPIDSGMYLNPESFEVALEKISLGLEKLKAGIDDKSSTQDFKFTDKKISEWSDYLATYPVVGRGLSTALNMVAKEGKPNQDPNAWLAFGNEASRIYEYLNTIADSPKTIRILAQFLKISLYAYCLALPLTVLLFLDSGLVYSIKLTELLNESAHSELLAHQLESINLFFENFGFVNNYGSALVFSRITPRFLVKNATFTFLLDATWLTTKPKYDTQQEREGHFTIILVVVVVLRLFHFAVAGE